MTDQNIFNDRSSTASKFTGAHKRNSLAAALAVCLIGGFATTASAGDIYINDGTDGNCNSITGNGTTIVNGNYAPCSINSTSSLSAGALVLNGNGGFFKGNWSI